MTYGDFKDLPRRTASAKVLHDKAFNIAKNPKDDGFQRKLASMNYKFFDKKSSGGALTRKRPETLALQDKYFKSKIIPKQQLSEE